MRGKAAITWDTQPLAMVPLLDRYRELMRDAIHELATFFANRIEEYAELRAPWNDQTGDARRGLRAFAVTTATRVVIYLVHTVFYGKFLERGTQFMAPRPIIMPALEAHYAAFMRAVRKLVGKPR